MGVRRGAEEIPLVLLQLPLSGAAPPGAPEFPEPPRKPPGEEKLREYKQKCEDRLTTNDCKSFATPGKAMDKVPDNPMLIASLLEQGRKEG